MNPAELIQERDTLRTENAQLRAEIGRLEQTTDSGVHSCSIHCQRPMCVLRRERDQAQAELIRVTNERREYWRELLIADGVLASAEQLARVTAERERLFDLVRYQRAELHQAELITDDEYTTLLADDTSKARLETYDALRARVAELDEKLAYVQKMGLRFGMMKTSDKPEPYLVHTWDKDSDHERMFREWSASIGWENRVAKAKARVAELEKELENANNAWSHEFQRAEDFQQRNAELVAALRLALGALEVRGVSLKNAPENSQLARWHALARAESATPAKDSAVAHSWDDDPLLGQIIRREYEAAPESATPADPFPMRGDPKHKGTSYGAPAKHPDTEEEAFQIVQRANKEMRRYLSREDAARKQGGPTP